MNGGAFLYAFSLCLSNFGNLKWAAITAAYTEKIKAKLCLWNSAIVIASFSRARSPSISSSSSQFPGLDKHCVFDT